jgi:probable phosphoglycerate mutase
LAACGAAGLTPATDERLREIDYGPDENRTEDETRLRLGRLAGAADDEAARAAGKAVLDAWNRVAAVPPGWQVDPRALVALWRAYGDEALAADAATTWAVTSNGVARFAVALTDDPPPADLKIATGALCAFEHDGTRWRLAAWNLRP